MTAALFQPFHLRRLGLANRVIVSPMCQYSADRGSATDWHLIHLGALTQSAAGLVLIEATAVSEQGRITPGCLGLWNDANEAALKRVLDAIRPHANAPIGIQLAHAGRKASSAAPWHAGLLISPEQGGWVPMAPSAVPHRAEEPAPRAMTQADIEAVIAQFAAAATRADRLGLQALELHCAHGYLLHEFLSPVSNRRTDGYGGSLENRMRLPLAVFDAVRTAWPADKPMGVRVSASDWLEHTERESWTLPQTLKLAAALQARGCDWIDVSSGGISPDQKIALGAGYQVHFAQAIRAATALPTMAVGLITEPRQAEDIVASGQADLVALGRAMLWNPRWVWHAAAQLGGEVSPPRQYGRAAPRAHAQLFAKVPFGMR